MQVKDPAMLRRWRKQRRYSQQELAFLVRRSQATIHLLETGKMKNLSEDLAIAIAARLEVPWEDLFELHEVDRIEPVASSASTERQAVAS